VFYVFFFVDQLKREFLTDAEGYGELSGSVGLCPVVQLVATLVIRPVQAACVNAQAQCLLLAPLGTLRMVSYSMFIAARENTRFLYKSSLGCFKKEIGLYLCEGHIKHQFPGFSPRP
jgi:hypothetical protein